MSFPRISLDSNLQEVARRVKCDEERPSCRKCSSTGRKCDGYTNPPKPTTPTLAPPVTSTELQLSTTLLSSLSLYPSTNAREQRSVHFFIHNTAPQLSGFYGEDFWDRLVLQTVHCEPVIYHAIIALGSMHERFTTNADVITSSSEARSQLEVQYAKDSFALSHYGVAIRSLVAQRGEQRPAMDVCLMACLLFACFEVSGAIFRGSIFSANEFV